MGLYDYVKCEYPLPDGGPQDAIFQTKDAQCYPYMERFRITAEGRLVHETCQYECVPRRERPYPKATGLMALAGSIRSIPTGDLDTNHHGELRFYTNAGEWIEYIAIFINGTIADIRRINAHDQ